MGVAYLSAFAAACPKCWKEVDAVALHWVRLLPLPFAVSSLTPLLEQYDSASNTAYFYVRLSSSSSLFLSS
jgi:hypothetical protein